MRCVCLWSVVHIVWIYHKISQPFKRSYSKAFYILQKGEVSYLAIATKKRTYHKCLLFALFNVLIECLTCFAFIGHNDYQWHLCYCLYLQGNSLEHEVMMGAFWGTNSWCSTCHRQWVCLQCQCHKCSEWSLLHGHICLMLLCWLYIFWEVFVFSLWGVGGARWVDEFKERHKIC